MIPTSRGADDGRRQGFSFVELLIALGALAVLLAVVLPGRGYLETARIQAIVQDVATLRQAADRWLERGRLDYTGLTVTRLQSEGFLPNGWRASTPYGGTYAPAPAPGNATRLTVTVTGLPTSAGTTLVTYYTGRVASVSLSGGTLTVTF